VEKVQRLSQDQITELSEIINNSKSSFTEGKKAQTILMLNKNNDFQDIKMFTGYSKRHAFTLRKIYLTDGLDAIKDKPRRVKYLLTLKQRSEVIDMLKNKTPKDSEIESNLWSTGILAKIIKRDYGVEYKSKTSLHLIFKEAKFSYHKPDKKYQRHNDEEIEKWKNDTKPVLEEAWKDPNIIILTEDEMVLSTQTTVQKVWLPIGEYPKIEVATKRENRSIYGFLELKTGIEHAFKTEWQNMYITVEVLKKLIEKFPQKTILIFWDQAGWHKGSEVKKYIEESNGKIKTIHFPAGAPELNPQEHVWKAGRSNVTHNQFIEDIDKASDQFVKFLNTKKFTYPLLDFSANVE
jgi:transposase